MWCRVRRGTSHHLRGKDGWQLGGLRTGPPVGPAYSFQRWQPQSLPTPTPPPLPPHSSYRVTLTFLPMKTVSLSPPFESWVTVKILFFFVQLFCVFLPSLLNGTRIPDTIFLSDVQEQDSVS